MCAIGRYLNVNQMTENSSTAENFMRSAKEPMISAVVMAANVDWKATKISSGMTTPLLKVAAMLSGVMPLSSTLSKPPMNGLPPVNASE